MTISWDWDDIGYPQEIQIEEICHTISHAYGGGYAASRPASQKMQKLFTLTWPAMTAAQCLNLIEFWRSVYGSADAFFWEFPVSLYGAPAYGGLNIGDPADGFDTDQEVGYGDPAWFTVRFAEDRLPQKVNAHFPGKWAVQAKILEVV